MPQVARPLPRCHDHRAGAIVLLAAIEQPQRLGDHPGGQVLLHGQWPVVEHRARVPGGVAAERDRHGAEMLVRHAELRLVALRQRGQGVDGRQHAERVVEALAVRQRVALAEALVLPLAQRTEHRDLLGLP